MSTKQELLRLLQQAGGTVSGQQVSRQLGVSRTAVWKAAQALRADGFPISGAPNTGYVLAPTGDVLSAEAVGVWLPGVPARVLPEVDSTNQELKRWALEGAPHGALVLAAVQRAGRGRMARAFQSPPGGLYMSVLLRPNFPAELAPLVTAAAAVAACRALQQLCGLSLGIKWVNDLYYEEKKVCGILCESAIGLEADALDHVVVGLGINYTTPPSAFAPELAGKAASLYPNGGAPVPRAQLAAQIQQELLALAEDLPNRSFLPEYRSRSTVLGKQVQVLARPPYTATALAIDDEGRLVVQTQTGARHTLPAGEISLRL